MSLPNGSHRARSGGSLSSASQPTLRPRRCLCPMSRETPKPIDFLIVVMRGKIGGNVGVISQVLEALDAQSYWGGEVWWGRPGDFAGRVRPGKSYRGRAALLINGDTRSAAEIMAYGFKR